MGRVSKEVRQKVFKRDGNKCLACDSVDNLTIDHVVPECLGGMNVESNMQTLCSKCNRKKGMKPIDYRGKNPVRLIRKEYPKYFQWEPEKKVTGVKKAFKKNSA